MKIGIATVGEKGLEDKVSGTFGRAETYTIIEIRDEKISNVKVLRNPATSYEYGAGPIVARMLIEEGVHLVVAGEIGPGVSSILKHHNVKKMKFKAGTQVAKVIKELLKHT
jgi:predicted Fe-Mo cluster-binding NifX family protein